MRIHALAAALFCSLAISGCGVAFRSSAEDFVRTQPPSAWGMQPPDGHRDVEKQWIKSRLKDPRSAEFDVGTIQRVVISASLTSPTVVPVWESTIKVNAKNSYGGYTGFKPWLFYYDNGTLYAVDSPESGRSYMGIK